MMWGFFGFGVIFVGFFPPFFSFSFFATLAIFCRLVDSPAYMVKPGGNSVSYNCNMNDCSVSKSIVQSRSNSVL